MRFGRTARFEDQDVGSRRRAEEDEQIVRDGFWRKAKRVVAGLPFAEDLLSAYYCAFDRQTPLKTRAVLLGALAYFVVPFDIAPDMLPMLGFADDAAVLATAMKLVIESIRPEHREAAKRKIEEFT